MKKVLMFNSVFTTAGISKIVSDYVDNMSNDIDVEIMTLKVIDDIYIKDNYKIHTIGKNKNLFKRIHDECRLMKQEKYDTIHINGVHIGRIIECIAAKRAGIKKIIVHSHSSFIGTSKIIVLLHKLFKKLFDFYATDYFACSDEAAKWMFSKKIYKNHKYKIINNGINTNLYKFNNEKRIELRKKLNCENSLLIGFVGRLEIAKNPSYIASILNECVKVNKNTKLLLIGTGTLFDAFMNDIKEYGIEDNVIHLNSVNNVYDYYNAMDVLILPSIFEGLPIVSVEAQTNGLKVLMSDRITKEVKLNSNVKYLGITEENLKDWKNEIFNDYLYNREDGIKNVITNKFDIKDVVGEIEKIYKGE